MTENFMPPGKIPKPVVLCILDGWGDREGGDDNAIHNGRTPNWDRMCTSYPKAALEASSKDVGLPEGQMGNSEVGHMNIGAGRVVTQSLPVIDAAIEDGSIGQNAALTQLIEGLITSGGVCHILGLASPGGVHSHQAHLIALAGILDRKGIEVRFHAFLDGRDISPPSALRFMEDIESATANYAGFQTASVSGRYYAMDRDHNWDRVARAYSAIAEGHAPSVASAAIAIKQSYARGVTDEFVEPVVIGDYPGMKDGDALLMFNFRSDRAREILAALVDPDFSGFTRPRQIQLSGRLGMTEYSKELNNFMAAMFPQQRLNNILGQVVSDAGLTQLRIAETEKYAHVTFFLNGGEEQVYPGEERILVPSPKVATYDLKPEMSAFEVTDKLVNAIEAERFDLIVVNYANGDMVGHTGDFDAAVKATEAVDICLGRLEDALQNVGGTMLLTADHGNVEQMIDPDSNGPYTAHTVSPVPVLLIHPPAGYGEIRNGILADIAPTILQIMGLIQPVEMSGRSLRQSPNNAKESASEHAPT
ncbi:MAG: 2,3-bisphosphoglycerate-independent phosphoglycerate mutase [Rhodospirillales bacterium]|nr:2,3-bisphosphoglycerate-independent phosphoglycerate mutase [Rhodospirillales bacterium]